MKATDFYAMFLSRHLKDGACHHQATVLLGFTSLHTPPVDGVAIDPALVQHPALPVKCAHCPYIFSDTAPVNVFYLRLFINSKGQLVTEKGGLPEVPSVEPTSKCKGNCKCKKHK
jgi:hypothetical protein